MTKALVSLFIFFSSAFFAHEFNPAHLLIDETKELEYEALWMTPIKNLGTSPELSFPEICEIEKDLPFRQGKYISEKINLKCTCLLYTSPSPRDMRRSRMPSSA